MSVNLELKIRVNSHNRVKKILSEIGAVYSGLLLQKDIYYQTEKGLLKMRIEGKSSQLIFYNRDEKGKDRWSDYHILKFDSAEAFKYFDRFMTRTVVVQKRRELYIFHDTRIHLDTVKLLGRFIELETVVKKSKADARKQFDHLVKIMGFNLSDEIKASYRNLIEQK
ncbi:MAG: class IV adenylate cyclase [bacterium]